MMILASSTIGIDVFSLRNGYKIASITGILIDPNLLKVIAFWALPGNSTKNLLIVSQDIRELSIQGIAVNDTDALSSVEDLPALHSIIELDYQIPGKKVVGSHAKYGTASDFSYSVEHLTVTSIIGTPTLARRLAANKFIFQRQQIESIDDRYIHIKDDPLTHKLRNSIRSQAPVLKAENNFSSSHNNPSSM